MNAKPDDRPDLAGYTEQERVVILAAERAIITRVMQAEDDLATGKISGAQYRATINDIRRGLGLPPLEF